MNLDKLKEYFEKIPISMILSCYLAYLAYDVYQFYYDSDSELLLKRKQIEQTRASNAKLTLKLKELEEFAVQLEQKKQDVRRLWQELQDVRVTLSEVIDVPTFMKMTITEARRAGINVLSLQPVQSIDKEFYTEQSFKLVFKSAFVQLLVFLDRLSSVPQVVRVDDFSMHPYGLSTDRYVGLDGEFEIKTYKYNGSKADSLASAAATDAPSVPRKQ